MKQGYQEIDISNFEDDLYGARFELTNSRIMDTSLPELEDLIIKESKVISIDGKTVTLKEMRHIMANCKQLCLTAF